jgi:hypothetical protein
VLEATTVELAKINSVLDTTTAAPPMTVPDDGNVSDDEEEAPVPSSRKKEKAVARGKGQGKGKKREVIEISDGDDEVVGTGGDIEMKVVEDASGRVTLEID